MDINAVLDRRNIASKLIIIACSGTKRADAGTLPAIDRYNGPMWQTLRASLARHPAAAQALASGDLAIRVVSGLYGLISADTPMPDYDQRITPELITKMSRDNSYDFQSIPGLVDDADAVLFAGGSMYRDAMRDAARLDLVDLAKISETDGGGIGEHRAQLARWIARHFASRIAAAETMALAA